MHYGTYNIWRTLVTIWSYTCRNLDIACNEFSNLKWMYLDQDRLFIELRAWVEKKLSRSWVWVKVKFELPKNAFFYRKCVFTVFVPVFRIFSIFVAAFLWLEHETTPHEGNETLHRHLLLRALFPCSVTVKFRGAQWLLSVNNLFGEASVAYNFLLLEDG